MLSCVLTVRVMSLVWSCFLFPVLSPLCSSMCFYLACVPAFSDCLPHPMCFTCVLLPHLLKCFASLCLCQIVLLLYLLITLYVFCLVFSRLYRLNKYPTSLVNLCFLDQSAFALTPKLRTICSVKHGGGSIMV